MGEPSSTPPETSASLLALLRDPTQREAWQRFDAAYREVLLGWCRRCGLQEEDAEDVTQEILITIHQRVAKFTHDPERGRFRDWLRKVTRNACLDVFRQSARSRVQALAGEVDAIGELDRELERQAHRETLYAAFAETRNLVSPRDWQVFEWKILEDRPTEWIIGQTPIKVAHLHVITGRVRKLVQAQLKALGEDEEAMQKP